MSEDLGSYLLAEAPNEAERLQKWGRIWEPEAEAVLNQINVQPGWHCLDLGCGPMEILAALCRRVGPQGKVTAVDINPAQLHGGANLGHQTFLILFLSGMVSVHVFT